MTIEKIREKVSQVYSGPMWRLRVSGMNDRQVYAIYKSMEREGRLDGEVKYKQSSKSNKKVSLMYSKYTEPYCEQLNMFDFL